MPANSILKFGSNTWKIYDFEKVDYHYPIVVL